jgi:5-methyltetrahydropteroyltriglutamate--homocysteine methyltransferase
VRAAWPDPGAHLIGSTPVGCLRSALIPGVITHGSNFVEHPEAIAQRIAWFAEVVGRERLIAGADCGFASFSTTCEVHPTVVWAKLAALAEGARLATGELWDRA